MTERRWNYKQETEIILRMLAARGIAFDGGHYAYDRSEYAWKSRDFPTFKEHAHRLWNVEDSIFYVHYKGVTRWIRFTYGNSFGELPSDWSCPKYGTDPKPIDVILEDVLINYSDRVFKFFDLVPKEDSPLSFVTTEEE